MSDPRCPACRTELTLTQALHMPNPWRYECPECSAALEAGPSHKLLALAGPPLMLVAVGIPLALKQAEVLNPAASFTLMLAGALSVLAATIWTWQRTTFKQKSRR